MKNVLALLCAALISAAGYAQSPPYKVVFDLTSRDSLDQKAVIRWIHEITDANPSAQLEIVMYGKGFELVMPERSSFAGEVRDAMKNPNVTFAACAVALRSNKVDKSQLIPGVRIVPDGIYEIISKQHDQWGYIKVGH